MIKSFLLQNNIMENVMDGLEDGLYSDSAHGLSRTIGGALKKAKISLKAYAKVLGPYYKQRWEGFRRRYVLKYPQTSMWGGLSLILTPVAILTDPRWQPFAIMGMLLGMAHFTDRVGGPAPEYYKYFDDDGNPVE
jgi:hypothetical protein